MSPKPFGVHSEYGRLNAVMVGQVEEFAYPPYCANLRYLTGEKRQMLKSTNGKAFDLKNSMPSLYDKLVSQLELVCETFRSRGVDVCRPRIFTDDEKAFLASLQPGYSQLYPADPVFVLGDHFIEACIRRPFRRKEVWGIRDVVMPLIEADSRIRHVAMPPAQPDPADLVGTGHGIYLEGGDIILQGKTVLVGYGPLTSSLAGGRWLARYLEPFGYKITHVEIHGDYLHLLGVMALLREGLAISYLPALGGSLPGSVKDWEVIELTLEECLALATVGMNIDPRTHLIDRRLTRVIREIEKRGVDCIPLEIDELADWGGAVRCVTLPISRDA
ncbi:MAG: dimethylarginine dimethylaminohydrolase family protein [Parvibaculaceae bacterium]